MAPVVVVFDDVQWAEETFVDLVEHVALLSSGSPILLLCMARPELSERRSEWPVTARLEPLAEEDVDALIGRRVPAELRGRIARASGGNPLFVSEMLVMAEQTEGEVGVPPTLRALLAARLDQLEPAERRVLEVGAVEGEVFHRGAVHALAPEEGQVTPRLAALVRKQLIRPDRAQLPGEDGFRFRHLLIRDTAYSSLPKTTRANLHQRFAGWLELRASELAELDELVGYHLEQAYRYSMEVGPPDERGRELSSMAAGRLGHAGRRALQRADAPAAVNLLSRASSLLPADSQAQLQLLPDLADALQQAAELGKANAVLSELIELAKAFGERRLELRAIVEQCDLGIWIEPGRWTTEQTRKTFEDAIAELDLFHDDRGLARAWAMLASEQPSNAASRRTYRACVRVRPTNRRRAGASGDHDRDRHYDDLRGDPGRRRDPPHRRES